MKNPLFYDRLQKELDNWGLPTREDERAHAFAKLMHIKTFQALSYLQGMTVPDQATLEKISQELNINANWLLGKSEDKNRSEH